MADLAKHIKVTLGGVEIDGQEFPWYISEEGASTSVSRDRMPTVTLTLMAERVEVDHRSPGSPPEPSGG